MKSNWISNVRYDLGFKKLKNEWQELFSIKYLKEDFIAGLTVGCVAVPLSLAIALASGVEPVVGLVTAIVSGIIGAFFGGTKLAVTGPAAAMAVIVATVVQQYGLGALLIVGIGCGLLQLLSGVFGLGKWAQFVPMPVVAGFTAGIGAIIFIGQMPRALGLPSPDQSHVIDVFRHLGQYIHETKPVALLLAINTIFIAWVLPKIWPRVPAVLIAVVIPSVISVIFNFEVPRIGAIPNVLPLPKIPAVPNVNFFTLIGTTFIIFALASLETLLSSSVLDKTTKTRHDSNQELIGQGLANIFSALFGGIPVTGVIARSALNYQAGAKTRRAALIHAAVLICTAYILASVIGLVPIAVLAGVLLTVAMRMISFKEFSALWRVSKIEGLVYGVTFLTIVFVDLMMGVQAGFGAALFILAIRQGQLRTRFHSLDGDGPCRLTIEGAITFMSTAKIAAIRETIDSLDTRRGVVIDMSRVTAIDASGAEQVVDFILSLKAKSVKVALQGVVQSVQSTLIASDHTGFITQNFAVTETDVNHILQGVSSTHTIERLVYGVERFQRDVKHRYTSLFAKLADGQDPHTLFITCSDSRINPNLITSTDPGELFIVRNVGNVIPPFGTDSTPAEGAAVEFAIEVLGVKEIVVCGHSGCGAMKAILSGKVSSRLPSLELWLSEVKKLLTEHTHLTTEDDLARTNILQQIKNLKTHKLIAEKIAQKQVTLHAWFYDIGSSGLEAWSETEQRFVPMGRDA